MYKIESLLGGYKIAQSDSVHKLGTDAVLLAAWARPPTGALICDLGCGAGAVSLLLAARHPDAEIHGVELTSDAAELFRYNIELNGRQGSMKLFKADIKSFPGDSSLNNAYSCVVCNPPYSRLGSGISPESGQRLTERAEHTIDIGDVCRCAARILKFGGTLSLVCRADRLSDIVCELRASGLECKRLKTVQNKLASRPSLILVEGKKGAAPGIIIEPPLIMRDENGETPEFKGVYRGERL